MDSWYIICIVETNNSDKILFGIHEGSISLERHRDTWEGNIKMYLTEAGYENVEWIENFLTS